MISVAWAKFSHTHMKPSIAAKWHEATATLQVAIRGLRRAVYLDWKFV